MGRQPKPDESEIYDNGRMKDYYIGSRRVKLAVAFAQREGYEYQIIPQANGHHGMHARTDCFVLRPMTPQEAELYPPLSDELRRLIDEAL